MFDALEQLQLEIFVISLHDVDGAIAELGRKSVVDFGTREKQRSCSHRDWEQSAASGDILDGCSKQHEPMEICDVLSRL